jgi:AraC family transcriptional activator of pobA
LKIPIYNQRAEAVGGIYIAELTALGRDTDRVNKLGTHRDDFYIFLVLTKGKAIMECDMIDVKASEQSIIMVKPFQILLIRFN